METFIIKLVEPVTPKKVEALSRKISALGGKIELTGNKGSFIVNVDSKFFQEIRRMPIVKLMGGVSMQKRVIPVIKPKQR